MALRVYNTLTRKKQEFVPRAPGRVDIYQCGITPYDYTHMGHARQYVFWDTVRRYLRYRGWKDFCVQNVTDVDDRIIERARAKGVSPGDYAEEYHRDFVEVMDKLWVQRPDVFPKVTEHIEDILRVIQGLVDKGFAYEVDGDVFFDVTRFPGYGKLSGRSLEEMQAGARVEVDPRKHHPMDFALWKAAKPGEPAWESPWGPGRPGWHIECSAMALKYLGSGFDFHGGGDELIFPHHENEIAQSEAYTGQEPFARHFVHHAMLNVNDVKMSKSLGNFFAVRDVLREFEPGVIRYYFAARHYRSPAEYGPGELDAARKAYDRLRSALDVARRTLREADAGTPERKGAAARVASGEAGERGPGVDVEELVAGLSRAVSDARERFVEGMDDDFNTAVGVAALHDLARAINDFARGAVAGPRGLRAHADELRRAVDAMEELGGILGLFMEEREEPSARLVDDLVGLVVRIREELRKQKQWALADMIRDGLGELGISLEDTATGTVWTRER